MMIMTCINCWATIPTEIAYHKHNINLHSIAELSIAIIKLQKMMNAVSPLILKENKDFFKTVEFQDLCQKDTSKKEGLQTDCMDEVIELGHNEGADNLTIQSLFLKSNLSPFSNRIIEVEEYKWSQFSNQDLSQKINAVVCNFDRNMFTIECSKKTIGTNSVPPKKSMNNSSVPPSFKDVALCPKDKSKKINEDDKLKNEINKTIIKGDDRKYNEDTSEAQQTVKVVLRSGRTIKSRPKDDDFIYFSDLKEKNRGSAYSKKTYNDNSKLTKSDAVHVGCSKSSRKGEASHTTHCNSPVQIGESTALMDIFGSLNVEDWNIDEELDISIEDLEIHGFEDLNGTLPENQILTVESLLQELEGGGSIEVSNVIKENNLDSEMVVLDALSQSSLNEKQKPVSVENNNNVQISGAESTLLPNCVQETEISESPSSIISSDCSLCGKKYKSKANFQRHLKKYHCTTNWMKYKCVTCNKMFGYLSALERHTKQHNPTLKYVCRVCGKQYKKLKSLKYHFSLHSKEKQYNCPFCDKIFFLKYSYNKHLKTHSQFEVFKCNLCERTFSDKNSYKKHIKCHTDKKYLGMSKNFKCNRCGDIRTAEEISIGLYNSKRFIVCMKCSKGIYKKYLIGNSRSINDDNEGFLKTREKCNLCNKNVLNLKRHIKENHLSNPYVNCDICGQSVKKSSLPSHKLRKHEGTAVSCDHCNSVFKNVLSLEDHLNKVRREESSFSKLK